jgi:transposase
MQDALFNGMEADAGTGANGHGAPSGPPRVRRPDRAQLLMRACCLEDLLPPGHTARLVERVVGRLDLSAFYGPIAARGSAPGRSATDPALLVALWLYAAIEGIGCGREIDRLCTCRDDFRWLCGGVTVNYHTLNDFRVGHEAALDRLFSNVLVMLATRGLVRVDRICQDGVRIRASAGTSSFHRAATTRGLLKRAQEHLDGLKKQMDPAASSRAAAARERAARERVERLEAALEELPEIEAARARWTRGEDRQKEARASGTDPQARIMRMSNGGYNPAYNVQLAADPVSRALVGVDVTNQGADSAQSEPMREQVHRRLGGVNGPDGKEPAVREHVADGGYADAVVVERAEKAGVTMVVPPRERKLAPGTDPATGVRESDPAAEARWRERMSTDDSRAIYAQRGSTIETINADLKEHRGLVRLQVRGLRKARCVALWSALAYNIMHFAPALLT